MWKRSSPYQGTRGAQDSAGYSRSRSARAYAANHPGRAIAGHQGLCGPRSGAVYARACELCRQVGETSQLFPGFADCGSFISPGGAATAHELGEQILSLTNSVQDPALLPEIHRALGAPYWLGEFAPARVHLEEGITLYNPQQHRSHTLVCGLDPGVPCLSFTTMALWSLGYPDQALKRGQEALTLAQGLFHPPSLAFALLLCRWLHWLRREEQTARERAEAMIALCTEQGFAFWLATGNILRGWAWPNKEGEEGIVRYVRVWLPGGDGENLRTSYLALLTEACRESGTGRRRADCAGRGIGSCDKTGERWYEAELHRLKGKLTLQKLSVISSQLSVLRPNTHILDPRRSRSMFSEGHRDCPAAAGQVVRTACGNEPGSVVATTR